MPLITPDYARENARLHSVDPKFGAEGYLWAYHVAGIALVHECKTILDYGCGKGTLGTVLRDVMFEHEHLSGGVQFAFGVREYDPGIPGKDARPSPADLVASLDVLEHIEPDCVDDVLGDLARLSIEKLFVVISTKPSKRIMADGRDTHVSLHDDAWWAAKFKERGFVIEREWNTGLRLWVALLSPPSG